MLKVVAGIAVITTLVGCVPAPRMMMETPDQYVVEYDPALSTAQDAAKMADAHCGQQGKRSALAAQGRSGALGGLMMLTFDCR
ncbi:hypothetical protein GAY28_00360 [Azospirillum brasilense]|nr:hypothetical protein [Azospirillum brasilense]